MASTLQVDVRHSIAFSYTVVLTLWLMHDMSIVPDILPAIMTFDPTPNAAEVCCYDRVSLCIPYNIVQPA